MYILDGSATLITGGTIPDARPPGRTGVNFTATGGERSGLRPVGGMASGRRLPAPD